MKRVRFDEAELVVPGFGPRATLIAGEPEAVARYNDVVSESSPHGRECNE